VQSNTTTETTAAETAPNPKESEMEMENETETESELVTEEGVEFQLAEAIEGLTFETEDGYEYGVSGVETFKRAGLLTRDSGLVVHLRNGQSFQLTIVEGRSRR
jgi:hypothetical protein